MKPRKPIPHSMAPRDRLELFGYSLDNGQPHRRRNVTRIMQIALTGALLIPSLVVILVPGFDGFSETVGLRFDGNPIGLLAEEMTLTSKAWGAYNV